LTSAEVEDEDPVRTELDNFNLYLTKGAFAKDGQKKQCGGLRPNVCSEACSNLGFSVSSGCSDEYCLCTNNPSGRIPKDKKKKKKKKDKNNKNKKKHHHHHKKQKEEEL